LALAPRQALAQGALAEAEAAYAQIDFENALARAQEAVESGRLSSTALARAYELIGISATALEQRDRSRQAFINMLALNPDAQLERSLAPSLRESFMEARGFWATQTDSLAVSVDFIRERGVLRVTITDPVRIARTVLVNARVEGQATYAESREDAANTVYVSVEGADATTRVEYTLQLLDEYGNRLQEIGDEEVPEVLGEAVATGGGTGQVEEPRSRVWVWVLVGVLAAGAIAGGVTAGVVLNQQANTVSMTTEVTLGM